MLGDARLVVSLPAKIVVKTNELFPEAAAAVLGFANRLLPQERTAKSFYGNDSSSSISPSWATALNEKAAANNNEVA